MTLSEIFVQETSHVTFSNIHTKQTACPFHVQEGLGHSSKEGKILCVIVLNGPLLPWDQLVLLSDKKSRSLCCCPNLIKPTSSQAITSLFTMA